MATWAAHRHRFDQLLDVGHGAASSIKSLCCGGVKANLGMRRYAMRRSLEVSRRQFLHTSTTGAAATIVATTGPAGAGEPPVQAPPPASTAPRVLRKPPLSELERIAAAYELELSQDDLTSF